VHAFGLRLDYAFKLAFATNISSEPGKDAQHVEEALPGRGAGIYRLFGRLQPRPGERNVTGRRVTAAMSWAHPRGGGG